ncbi:hypothetical protein B0H11DRAFT_422247 [Mycena galericulata]|nr:hypothetical protein B0H11DRAFT_422247 [Mycena galericulata]
MLTTDPLPSNPTPDSSTQERSQPRPKKRKNPPASEESSTASSAHVFKVPAVPQRAVQESAPGSVSSSTIPTPAPSAPLKKKKKIAGDKPPSSTSDPVAREALTSSATKKKKTIPADVPSQSANASADSVSTTPSKKTPVDVPTPSTVKSTTQGTLMATGSHPLPAPNVSKRPSTTLVPADPPPKKRKVISPSSTPQLPSVPKFVLPRKAPAVATPSTPSVVPEIPINVLDMRPKVPQKRFVPLVVTKKVPAPAPAVAAPPDPAFVPIAVEGSAPQPLYYLDFPIAAPPKSLSMITLPPSLSQRKRVPRFALFLSSVADEDDLRNCLLVSRMFRYAGNFYPLVHAPYLTISVAVYLSAAHRLDRDFAGQRLSAVLAKYPRNTTNMWPYLEQRQQELSARKRQYTSSFLGRLFPRGVISDHLWTSPDHERQIVVALRFLLTRLFFQVSVGGGKEGEGWREGQIVNTEQLVEDEIWEITVRHSATSTERFYVLEPTCEPLTTTTDSPETGLPVRTDWSAYIAHRTLSVDSPPPRLLNYMSWTNHEEYLLGISRLWLKRIEDEGEIGIAKRITAERYILACVVGNSVSGRWMSSTQMAQDFAGLADNAPARVTATPKVNLFLPKHHHVESVHFATSGRVKTPLHSALAVVQTPDREYFILRDNGMQVGCEEEGIAEAWMNIIGCTNAGVATGV